MSRYSTGMEEGGWITWGLLRCRLTSAAYGK